MKEDFAKNTVEALMSLLSAMQEASVLIKEMHVEIELLKLRVSNLEYCTQTKFYMPKGGQG